MNNEFILSLFSMESIILLSIGIIASMVGALFGAAGLVTLPAMLLVGIPIHTSVAVNKFATGLSAFTNVITFFIKKKLSFKKTVLIVCIAFSGGIVGAYLATLLTENVMNIVACFLLIVALITVLTSRKYINNSPKQEKEQPIQLYIPFFISVYDGGFGPGSASMSITYYLKKKHSYYKAVEFSRIVIFSSCFGAFLWYFFHGIINWGVAIPITIGSIIGSHLGIKLIPKIPMKWVRVVLPIIFIALIFQVISHLLF
ncbi:sulfite exporter TauE/SafE family protein [Ectobacillus polymachus]|uniref:sulfite exporter TauE/SafE family protein n=1 Tax=Ectobacillus polymachus TaxID=1508806 RepID=UPI003A876C56